MRSLSALIFDGFETLDLFGPIEMFGSLPKEFEISLIAENMAPVTSCNGQRILPDYAIEDAPEFDMILVPGGPGTPIEIPNETINGWLQETAKTECLILSVCTGSALLARSGILDGRKATTNKMAFKWARSFGKNVDWVPKARWVEDGNFFTSSGVSAGMDMSLAVISHLLNETTAVDVANQAEYEWHQDPAWDPFYELYET